MLNECKVMFMLCSSAHAHNSRVNFFTTLISILVRLFLIQEITKSRVNMAVIKFELYWRLHNDNTARE